MTRPAAILFDADGTLVDSLPAVVHSFQQALVDAGLPRVEPDDLARWVGLPLLTIVKRAVPPTHKSVDHEAIAQAYRQHFLTEGLKNVVPLVDAAELAESLRAVGIATGVITQRERKTMDPLCAHLGWTDRLGPILCAEELPAPKPDTGGMLQMCASLQVGAGDVWYVGDSRWDMQMAVDAGARAVGVTTGRTDEAALREAGASVVLASVRELSSLL